MRTMIAAALAASMLALPAANPASAFPVDTAAHPSGARLEQVAFRRIGGFHGGGLHIGGLHGGAIHHGFGGFHRGIGGLHRGFVGHRFGGFHHGVYGRRLYGRRFYGGRRFGIGAGIAGLAAGAIIGSAVAGAARASDSVAYCESRFRSYSPATGTYLGYDGLRHHCP